MINKIDLLCYYDSLQKPLFDLFFYPSFDKHLSNNFNLIEEFFHTPKSVSSGWYSDHWSKILIERIDFIKNYIHNNNSDKWCIFSDIDIIFLDNFIIDIQILLNNFHDIYYMSETLRSLITDVNGGFFLFRCNEATKEYLDFVQQKTKQMAKPNDQVAIQEILKTNIKIRNSVLPRTMFMTNNNPQNKIATLISNNTLKVFHATVSKTLMEKIQILSTIKLFKDNNITNGLWIPQI